jgi:hypothetical protein
MKSMTTSAKSARRRFVRAAPVLAAAFLLGACGGLTPTDMDSIYEAAQGMWSGSRNAPPEKAVSTSYTSMVAKIGGEAAITLTLVSDSDGRRLWRSPLGIAIATRDGRIVEIAGLEHNLSGFEMASDQPANDGGRTIRWQADFPELGLYSVMITCRRDPGGEEEIALLGKAILTKRIDETCTGDSRQLDWSFKNTYWADPANGLVWRSIQHLNPKLDAIETEILRPPA